MIFREGVHKPADLEVGMELQGIVTNVTDFGAFVDVGVHQDGLVHLSEISHHYVKNPADALSVGQSVRVKVLAVDLKSKRIGLSIKALLPGGGRSPGRRAPRRTGPGPGPRGPAQARGEAAQGQPRPPRPPRPAGPGRRQFRRRFQRRSSVGPGRPDPVPTTVPAPPRAPSRAQSRRRPETAPTRRPERRPEAAPERKPDRGNETPVGASLSDLMAKYNKGLR